MDRIFRALRLPNISGRSLVVAGISIIVLSSIELYSFLLFHVLIEIFSVIVAFAIFMFAWNTRVHLQKGSLTLLGAAFMIIGAVDLLHTLSYKGMGVFQTHGADTATQLWIVARYIEAVTLAAAPFFAERMISIERAFAVYAALFILMLVTVFFWPVFPKCFVDGVGLTPFKKISEYIIAAILLAALVILKRHRPHFDENVYKLLAAAIICTIVSEVMFTFYISVYGISNLAGHVFKLISFWLIYKAILETGLQQPFTFLFRELADNEKRFRDLVSALPTGICTLQPDGSISYMNPAGLAILGYESSDLAGGIDLSRLLDSEDHERKQNRIKDLYQGKVLDSTEYRMQRKDGAWADVLVHSTPVYREGRLSSIQTSLIDVTEFSRLKTELQQTQKMEAIALLAGGMAHRINNMLMGVVGRIELLRFNASQQKHASMDKDLADVLGSCERIAVLIRSLLAYSRGGRYQSQVIDLKEFMPRSLPEISARLKPGVQLRWRATAGVHTIMADPRQLQMVVSEVVSNAVEAVEGHGHIDIAVDRVHVDEAAARPIPAMPSGDYILFEVRDTGKGMEDAIAARIFEPFYTTKVQGRGLGMAAVYGIIKNHGGWIGVDSKPGQGTTVRIYFPVLGDTDQAIAK
ncbi:MAG: ATP-binding protein [Desulfobacteraceae bacterium]|nr:ATP-binding protein [Desulfobacteraceae bacterium]